MIKYIYIIFFLVCTQILIFGQNYGDVNGDSFVDIVDALIVAQYYTGLDPFGYIPGSADVDKNGVIDIIDALLIGRYYEGILNELPVDRQFTEKKTITPRKGTKKDYRIIGYFPQWGVYTKNYYVKNIVTSGSAEKLNVINYAFGNIVDCECVMKTESGVMDAYADYQKIYSAEESIDNTADIRDQRLRGNFNQLKKLKQLYPHIKIIISLGGYGWSGGFHEASLTDENRKNTVSSCIDIYIRGNLPVVDNAGGDGTAAGIFNGIDIDWEYPNHPGNGNPYGPEDIHNFTLLLAEFRKQLDDINPDLLLTVASPAGENRLDDMELDEIHYFLDWISVMNYNYHGPWDTSGPTNHMSPLYGSPEDPSAGRIRNNYTDYTIKKYIKAGVPLDKINIGVPFYGRGWDGVKDNNNGLYQKAAGPAPGTYSDGVEDYNMIKNRNFPEYWDPAAQASWCFDGEIFWSYDSPVSLLNKMDYVKSLGLGGVMFWGLSGDTPDGELITALYKGLE